MKYSMIIAGFGGQGVLSLGKLLCYAADSKNLKATFFPSYGGEQRGGTCNCTVVISDEKIGTPIVKRPDYLVVMNEPSLKKFEDALKPSGKLFINDSIVTSETVRNDVEVIKVSADEIAKEVGNEKAGNMIMLGSIMKRLEISDYDETVSTINEVMGHKKQYLEANVESFRRGYFGE